ncbi:MAG: GIY-YIG nuclease family protein [Hyphomicrobium sp.]
MYIAANKVHGTLYIGVTSDLHQRMNQHAHGLVDGFTKRYSVKMLVYYEMFATMPEAIAREKQLKAWNRAWKIRLIEQMNPEWKNLFDQDTGEIAFGPAEAERLSIDQLPDADVPDSGLDGSPPSRG